MAAARMIVTLATMATRRAMCEQTLTQQEDNLFANLWLPDIIKSIKAGKPKYFLAPTWSEVNEAEAPEQGKLTAQRRLYYSGLMIWTVFATVAAGTAILATNHFVRQRCPASDRHYLQLPGQQSTENVGERARTLQKLRVITLFLIHVVLLTVYMLQASRTGELTPKLGLSWERWLLLLAASCAWTIAQALWAVLTCQATAPRFSAGTFPTALVVYNFPVVSDGFDTCKDVAFIATLLSMDATWANALGCLCWAWLVGLYTFMIWTDNEVEDAVVLSFASVTAALNKQVAEQALADEAVAEEPEASTSSWFNIKAKVQAAQEKALTLAFFQTTRQKRRLLLLEDGFQGVCAGLTILGTGGGVGAFFFIAMMNIALPGCKWLFAWAFHPSIAATLRDWIFKEAEVARNAGLTARFENLRVKLIEIMEGDQESEEWFPAGTEVNDQHARLVAWSLQDSEKRAWIIKDGACHVTKKGWETLTVATASQDGGLQKLVLNGVKDLTFDALAAAVKTKDSSLRELSVQNADIGAAGAEALANIVANQECPLRELDLQGNGIGDAGAQALADVISKQECGLTHLELEYNNIGDQGAAALANAIGFQDRFHSLRAMLIGALSLEVDSEELCFPGIAVNDGHAYLAAWAFKDCAARKLVIKDGSCQITQRGWEALTVITDASSQECSLKKLDLMHCIIGDSGAIALGRAIRNQDCGLTELELGVTGIGDDGAKHLAVAISDKDCSLRKLSLFKCNIRDEGAGAFVQNLAKEECRLEELHLGSNRDISNALKRQLRAINKPGLKVLVDTD